MFSKRAVEAIAHRLVDNAALQPILDRWRLIPGEPWREAIAEALGHSATVAVVVGPSGLGPWEHKEMGAGNEP